MRWIFYFLLFANIAALAVGLLSGGEVKSSDDSQLESLSRFAGVPTIRLLNESSAVRLLEEPEVTPKAKSRQVTPAVSTDVAESARTSSTTSTVSRPNSNSQLSKSRSQNNTARPLCDMVGAFPDKLSALEFMKKLSEVSVDSEIKELELPAGPGYWVYLEPESTRKRALKRLADLQERGVDSYVIPKGDLANGISLGMFSQKELSESRLREMKGIGLKPKVSIIERTYREIWVMLKPGEGLKMSSLTWGRVLDKSNELERRQNFCLDVAS